MKEFVLILSAVLIIGTLGAQSPERMSYQAVVRNDAGQLVTNTEIGMQISILQGTPEGTVVYSEVQTPTTNANGLVSIEIGTGITSDDFSAIDWADGPYFIKTEIAVEAPLTTYTIEGTSQILSVPYALHAKTVASYTETDPVFEAWDKSTGLSITESQISDLQNYLSEENDPTWGGIPNLSSDIGRIGNVGIGTSAPTHKLDIDGQIRIRGGNPGDGKVLTSDENGLAKWEESVIPDGNLPGEMLYWDGLQWQPLMPGNKGDILSIINNLPVWKKPITPHIITGVIYDANNEPVTTPTSVVLTLIEKDFSNYVSITQTSQEGTGEFNFQLFPFWSTVSDYHIVIEFSTGFTIITDVTKPEHFLMNIHENNLSLYGNPDLITLENIWNTVFPTIILPYEANTVADFFNSQISLRIGQSTEFISSRISCMKNLYVDAGGLVSADHSLVVREDIHNKGKLITKSLQFRGGNTSTATLGDYNIEDFICEKSGAQVIIQDVEFEVLGNTLVTSGYLYINGNAEFNAVVISNGSLNLSNNGKFSGNVIINELGLIEMINATEAMQIELLSGIEIYGNLQIQGPGHNIIFGAGSYSRIRESGNIWIEGEPSAYIKILSTVENVQWFLRFDPESRIIGKYISVQNSDASLGNTVQAIESENLGNNVNWNFGPF